jgi:hypothetical protein
MKTEYEKPSDYLRRLADMCDANSFQLGLTDYSVANDGVDLPKLNIDFIFNPLLADEVLPCFEIK